MKTNLIFTFTLCITYLAQGQNALKFNAGSLITGKVELNYEHGLTNQSSILIGGAYLYRDNNIIVGADEFGGMGIIGQYRYFPMQEAITGLYLGGHTSIGFGSYSKEDLFFGDFQEGNFTTFELGALGGYQYQFGEHFLVDFFAVLGYQGTKVTFDEDTAEFFSEQADPSGGNFIYRLGIGLGYKFKNNK